VHQFWLVAPVLKAKAGAEDIQKAILEARTKPESLLVSDRQYDDFATRLEGHWGALHQAVPTFHSALMAGGWDGAAHQAVPSSLLGDFGEFLATEAFKLAVAGDVRIARVIRSPGLPRPDFIILDRRRNRLIALESKAATMNAARLRQRIQRTGKAYLNVCSTLRGRRENARPQIASSVVASSVGAERLVLTPQVNFGRARVPAHDLAIATPYLVDGRALGGKLPFERKNRPRQCWKLSGRKGCCDCLAQDERPLLLCPIFTSSPDEDEGLPLPERPDGFFDAYLSLNRAVWVDSPELYGDGFARVLNQWNLEGHSRGQRISALLPILDLIRFGVERDLASDPERYIDDVRERLGPSGGDELTEAMSFQEYEPEPEVAGVVVDEGATTSPREGRRAPRAVSVERLEESIWVERREESRVQTRRPQRNASLDMGWSGVADFLRADARDPLLLRVQLSNQRRGWIRRPPLQHGPSVLHVSADEADTARELLLWLFLREEESRAPGAGAKERASFRIRHVRDQEPAPPESARSFGNAYFDDDGFGWIAWNPERLP